MRIEIKEAHPMERCLNLLVTISETTKFFLASSVPAVKANSSTVGVKV